MNYQPDKTAIEFTPSPSTNPRAREVALAQATADFHAHNAHQRQLRIDTFACAAMQLIAEKQEGIPVYPFIAKECYDLAEAMEAERARRMKG